MVKYISDYNLRIRFGRHKVFSRITKATMVHNLIPKKVHIDADCNWIWTQNHLVCKRIRKLILPKYGSGLESSCIHLNFKFRACFEQGIPWHSGNYRVWIHSETCTCLGKSIQSHIDDFFFQSPSCWFISEHFWVSLTKSTTLSRDIEDLLF